MEKQGNEAEDGGEDADDEFGPRQWEVGNEVVDAALATLPPMPEKDAIGLRSDFKQIGEKYLKEKHSEADDSNPVKQRAAIQALVSKLDATLTTWSSISYDYVEIATARAPSRLECCPPPDPYDFLKSLRDQFALFLENFDIPRGARPKYALERAVFRLQGVFEERGIPFTFDTNKHGKGGPKANSEGAEAALALLTALEPRPTVTAIANMAAKLRQRPNLSLSEWDLMIRANPAWELNLSLLPNRFDD